MKKLIARLVSAVALFLPALALAQGTPTFGGIGTFLNNINAFINNILIPLVFAVSLLVFLYGIFKFFILGGGDDTSREEGKQLMIYAIAGFVVMVSIFGIVNLISSGLGFNDQQLNNIPNTPTSNGN